MTDNFIKLKDNDVLRLYIEDKKGNKTGEYLEFDLEDIEMPLRYQEMLEKEKKNRENIRNQFILIDKREDHKGKKLFSSNEEAKIKALQEFFNKEVEIYNMFLGEKGIEKLLNGKKLGWTSLNAINDIITEQIAPYLDMNMEKITNKIKNKYSSNEDKEVLK